MVCLIIVQFLFCSPMLVSGHVCLESDLIVKNLTSGDLTSGIKNDSGTVGAQTIPLLIHLVKVSSSAQLRHLKRID